MGTTADAIAAGGLHPFVYCLRIEGYPYILASTADPSAVVTAFAGSGYTQALSGLHAPGSYEQGIEPFSDGIQSGSMTFVVAPDADDTFAKDLFATNKDLANWVRLTVNSDPTDTTLNWSDTTDLPTSGTLYIGNEDTTYTGKTSTTTTGHTRAVHTPMTTDAGDEFARQYRIGVTKGEQSSFPYGTDFKRNWVGSWVVCTVHRVVDGVIDVLAQADVIFTGTVADVRDDAAGVSVLTCVDALEKLSTATLFNDQWSAEPAEGIYFGENTTLVVEESVSDNSTNSYRNTRQLEWDGTHIAEGRSTVPEVITAVNEWFRTRQAAGDLENQWMLKRKSSNSQCLFEIRINSTTASPTAANSDLVTLTIWMSPLLAGALGFDIATGSYSEVFDVEVVRSQLIDNYEPGDTVPATRTLRFQGIFPYAHSAGYPSLYDDESTIAEIESATGTFIDQTSTMPSWLTTAGQSTGTWGIVKFRQWYWACELVSDTQANFVVDPRLSEIVGDQRLPTWTAEYGAPPRDNGVFQRITEPIDTYRQVVILQDELDYLVTRFVASTGDAGFNHATYDEFPRQLSANGGIPWSALGDEFVNTVVALAQRSTRSTMSVVLDKPTRLAEVLVPELLLRNAYFMMKSGKIVAVSPSNPSQDGADHTITTSHRSAPRGDGELPQSEMSKDLIITEVNVHYDRSLGNQYRSSATVVNSQADADYGISRKIEIRLRNHLEQGHRDSDKSVLELLAQLSGDILAYYGRPIMLVSRTIDMSKAHLMVPGDSMYVTDDYVRDVRTGLRGVTLRPGWLMSIEKRYGEEGMIADAVIALHDSDILRTGQYVPATEINDTVETGGFGGGYNPTTEQVQVYDDIFTLPSEDSDASHIEVGDVVQVIELSPATPGTPQSWEVTIDAVSGNTFDLSAPLTGFDTDKKYYLTYAAYKDVQTSQQTKSFMGGNAKGTLNDERRPYEWTSQQLDKASSAAASTTTPIEYPVTSGPWDTDGRPVSPIIHRNAVRSANMLVNRFTAPQSPMVWPTGLTAGATTTYENFQLPFPYYVGDGISFELARFLNIGPSLRQSTSGTGTFRVTSSALQPQLDGQIVGPGRTAAFPGRSFSVEFEITSTSFTNVASQQLQIAKSADGPFTWITMESKATANFFSVYGFHTFWTGPLQ